MIGNILFFKRILVLSEGEVVEFEETQTLLNRKDSQFYQLYMKSS
jgi:ABC-type multidrug transport system fused ATPase/permease subunit